MATAYPASAPKHLWVVGILSLLWNGFGACDYVMSMTGNLAWFEMMGFGAEEVAWALAIPAWAKAGWAVGVWASVAGAVLLLLRSRHAATAFILSLVGSLASFVYQFMATDKPASMEGGAAVIMPLVVVVAIVAQWYYAKRQAEAGVLR